MALKGRKEEAVSVKTIRNEPIELTEEAPEFIPVNRNGSKDIRNAAIKELASDISERVARGSKESEETILSDSVIDAAIDTVSGDDTVGKADKYLLRKEIRDEMLGYGPIQDLINDATISEIMVNSPNQIYVERKGRLEKTDIAFDDEAHVRRIIDRIVSPLGRHIDDASPMVDARLPDGSRVNAVIPPISLKGASLTIRKFSKTPLTMTKLIEYGTLSDTMAKFLEAAVLGRMNILISGGTGSGKTTLLNVLSSYIPEDERIITIEDAAELKLMQTHVVSMEARPEGIDGTGEITIRDMVRNSLRMRPDRIVVGEVRGAEALDMLQAMNTGHDGSLTTAHANSPRDAVSRIETMALMSGMDIPVIAVRQQCAGAFNLIVQQARFRDGSRKVTSISEVTGMVGDMITLQEIFKYAPPKAGDDSSSGGFTACGIKPLCCEKIELNGIKINNAWFRKEHDDS